MDVASEYKHYEEKKALPGHSSNLFHHHSSHSAVLSSKPSATSEPWGVKAEPSSNPISLQPIQVCNSQHSGSVSTIHPPSPAALPSNHLEASSSHYLNLAQPHSPLRGNTELGRILEPGYLGRGSQCNVMRPQKGRVSGYLSSGSSVWADLLEEHLREIWNLRQCLEESICIN
uniref:Uncharacterized protein n=1 Tax=Neovison vison TaxID=452646 RepID=A0A8C7AAD4_NEOVI